MVIETIVNNVMIIQFNHKHRNNPFSNELMESVTQSLISAEKNTAVKIIILTGGASRSFSVGGDFNETKEMKKSVDVIKWIERVVSLYIASLETTKFTIAAIDNYAIGIGFQLALTCDWRIGTFRSKLIMPELKHGIACTLGQFMLEKHIGRARMLEIVYGCEVYDAKTCLDYNILNKICPDKSLIDESLVLSHKLLQLSDVAVKNTKTVINKKYIEDLLQMEEVIKSSHTDTFSKSNALSFMQGVVK